MDFQLPVTPGQYSWKYPIKADAQEIGEELETLVEENDGRLTKEAVVERARNPASPLHPLIEWDNEVAAKKFRNLQAAYIVRNIVFVEPAPTGQDEARVMSIRSFFNVIEEGERFYSPIRVVIANEVQREYAIREIYRGLAAWRRKSESFPEFEAIHQVIDNFVLPDPSKMLEDDQDRKAKA